MSIHGVLGETTHYPKTYDPSILYPIARHIGRDEIIKQTGFGGVYQGVDIWQAFELSWLNKMGVSQVAMARFIIPANSPNIVESKSLKLYLNSLNFTPFATTDDVKQTISADLSACVGADVGVQIVGLDDDTLAVCSPVGVCIDDSLNDGKPLTLTDDIDSRFLIAKQGKLTRYQFYSHLLRSNCPVTNQPDWGTVSVDITTKCQLDFGEILKYILSFRQHNGFHEQCVERIFADFMTVFEPSSLLVQANYTRRGGIDINPVRVFGRDVGKIKRLVRQ